jgi:Flp pilus assembly protein TadG
MPNLRYKPSMCASGPRAIGQKSDCDRRGVAAVEAAVCLPLIILLMMGMWEVGRIAQMSRILKDAAREGARVAAGGTNNGAVVTVANVQTAVQNYLASSGMPSAAANGAVVSVTNLSGDSWTNPGNAQPLDQFSVTVTIPAGAAFNSLLFLSTSISGVTQLQEKVDWLSANDSLVTVNTTLPY